MERMLIWDWNVIFQRFELLRYIRRIFRMRLGFIVNCILGDCGWNEKIGTKR